MVTIAFVEAVGAVKVTVTFAAQQAEEFKVVVSIFPPPHIPKSLTGLPASHALLTVHFKTNSVGTGPGKTRVKELLAPAVVDRTTPAVQPPEGLYCDADTEKEQEVLLTMSRSCCANRFVEKPNPIRHTTSKIVFFIMFFLSVLQT